MSWVGYAVVQLREPRRLPAVVLRLGHSTGTLGQGIKTFVLRPHHVRSRHGHSSDAASSKMRIPLDSITHSGRTRSLVPEDPIT